MSISPISQIPQHIQHISHNAPFCYRNVHICAHFCYKLVHCGIWDWRLVGCVQQPAVYGICKSRPCCNGVALNLGTTWPVNYHSTHWGRVTRICVSTLTIIGSDNGLSPGRRQAIIWTSAGILLTGPLGPTFSDNLIDIGIFSFQEMYMKRSSGKLRPFCLVITLLMRAGWITRGKLQILLNIKSVIMSLYLMNCCSLNMFSLPQSHQARW